MTLAIKYDGLTSITGYRFPVYASSDAIKVAHQIATRCHRAYQFLQDTLHTNPVINLLVLNVDDWVKYCQYPVYGMPHTTNGETLVVAAHNNDLWSSTLPDETTLTSELLHRFRTLFTQSDGSQSFAPFFNLLVVHELAHLFHTQAFCVFPRLWLTELFANLCLYAYVSAIEPEQLPVLETRPELLTFMDIQLRPYGSLQEFELQYMDIAPQNYAWYQAQFHIAVKRIYRQAGVGALQRLWQTFIVSDQQLATELEEVSSELAQMLIRWPSAT